MNALETLPTSNCERFAAKPLTRGGTPLPVWLTALDRGPLPPLEMTGCRRLVVVAPHPDDETLGLGATIAHLAASGVDVQVVSVSDGGAAHPGATSLQRTRMETTRRHELRRAAKVLEIPTPLSLGLPDGEFADHEDGLAEALTDVLAGAGPDTWCAATWRGDGHPDHEAVGRAAAAACARSDATLLEFPVWMWHWSNPADAVVPWARAHSMPVSGHAIVRKRLAAQCFRSQFEPCNGAPAPVLPGFVLPRLLAVGEVVFR